MPDHVSTVGDFRVLMGASTLEAAIAEATAAVPAKTPAGWKARTDAIKYVQVLLQVDGTALGGPKPGDWNGPARHKLEAAALTWLRKHCPGTPVSAVAHYDEMSPHIHVLVVPTTPGRNGKPALSREAVFGGPRKRELRAKMAGLQTTWAQACQAEGLDVQAGPSGF